MDTATAPAGPRPPRLTTRAGPILTLGSRPKPDKGPSEWMDNGECQVSAAFLMVAKPNLYRIPPARSDRPHASCAENAARDGGRHRGPPGPTSMRLAVMVPSVPARPATTTVWPGFRSATVPWLRTVTATLGAAVTVTLRPLRVVS